MYKIVYFSHSNVWCRNQRFKEDDSPHCGSPKQHNVSRNLSWQYQSNWAECLVLHGRPHSRNGT